MKEQDVIGRVREFNRFYTAALGMLNRQFLDSGYSVAENRILYELNRAEGCSANVLAEKLRIDKSYLSRILKGFEAEGLLDRRVSPEDGRAYLLRLTEKGRRETERLIEGANRQIGGMIAALTPEEQAELCRAMDLITEYLTDGARKRPKGER